MKIFQTSTFACTLLALLPFIQAQSLEDSPLTGLLKDIILEESMAQGAADEELVAVQSYGDMQSFSLKVTGCDEITDLMKTSLTSYLARYVSRKVTISCSGSSTGD